MDISEDDKDRIAVLMIAFCCDIISWFKFSYWCDRALCNIS